MYGVDVIAAVDKEVHEFHGNGSPTDGGNWGNVTVIRFVEGENGIEESWIA